MVVDVGIARKVWDGKIPCVFTLASQDKASMRTPDPVYMMLPRCSFFPLFLDDTFKQRFQEYAAKGNDTDDVWLEVDGRPLKWHVPIGAQFDLHGQQDVLPWAINVHFRQWPETLVRFGGMESLQLHFYSMLKQSEYVRTGATKKIMNMSKNEQTQLWEGLRTHNFDLFWQVNKQLLSDLTSNLKHVPIRLYLDDGGVVQDLIPPTLPGTPAGRVTTLVDVLRHCLPALFPLPAGSRRVMQRARAAAAATAAQPTPATPTPAAAPADADEEASSLLSGAAGSRGDDDSSSVIAAGADDDVPAAAAPAASAAAVDDTAETLSFASAVPIEVILQGVRPRPETPVVWLSDHLGYPDGFVHISVRRTDRL